MDATGGLTIVSSMLFAIKRLSCHDVTPLHASRERPCHLLDLDVELGCPFASWPLAAPFVQLWTCQCRACCYFWSFASQAGIEEMDNTMMKASYWIIIV